jgi:cytochrome c oxidase cbb3-type subunit 3
MKFKNYLETIKGVEIYPVFSLILFGIIFLGIVAYVITADKTSMNEHGNIPLQ